MSFLINNKILWQNGNNEIHKVIALDNLSNGRIENIQEFKGDSFKFIIGDIRNEKILDEVFKEKYDIIYHLALSIGSQVNIDKEGWILDSKEYIYDPKVQL